MSTVFITHPDYLKHNAGPGHPERPERLQAIATAIDQSPLGDALERIVPDPVDEEQLAAVHRREYIHQVRDLAAHSEGPSILTLWSPPCRLKWRSCRLA